jgi:acyl-CoA thioesterase II
MSRFADIMALIAPKAGAATDTWTMTAHRNLCLGPSGAKHLSGGSALASAVSVLEAQTGMPLIQANAQFLSSPLAGQAFEIEACIAKAGRSIVQASARLVSDDQVMAHITATLGSRDDLHPHVWVSAPSVPNPESCPPVPFVRIEDGDLHNRLDMRLALDPRGAPQGRACFWVRTDPDAPLAAPGLVLIADYLPEALHMNLGRPAGAVSLDNSIRIMNRVTTPWLLCDIHLSAIASGLFHGRMQMFSESGQLLAIGEQSGVVRWLPN